MRCWWNCELEKPTVKNSTVQLQKFKQHYYVAQKSHIFEYFQEKLKILTQKDT